MKAALTLRALAVAAAVVASALVAGCADDVAKPTPLEPMEAKIAGHEVWKLSLSSFSTLSALAGNAGFGAQGVAAAGNNFVIGALNGALVSVDAATGKENWRADAGGRLSAGIGTDGRFTSVVTRDGDLVTLDAGKIIWRKHLNAAVYTAPFVAGERVFVLGVDRSVQAFDAVDGKQLWTYAKAGDALTLSQAGVLTAWQDTLLFGLGARLTALDPLKGTVRWEVPVAAPRGTNEVERLADLVSPAARVGDIVCARAFQSAVSCADAARGTVAWTRPLGGTHGVAADEQVAVAADASDRISAWRLGTGELLWTSERLRYRQLAAPVLIGGTIAIIDNGGLVHFLARDTGEPLLRLPTADSPAAATVRVGNTLVVVSRAGRVFGFRLE